VHHKTYIACVFFTVDGAWSIWSNWGDCSLTCGDDGSRDRQRSCSAPAPQFGGSECMFVTYKNSVNLIVFTLFVYKEISFALTQI
jgi:hypothetical protein